MEVICATGKLKRGDRACVPCGRGRRGMTLLELAVVVVIIAIMLAAALPRFGPFRMKAQLRTSARSLAALVRYGRSTAVYRRRNVYLRIDLEEHRYRLDLMEGSVRASDRDDDEVELVEAVRTLPDKVMFDRVVLYDGQKQSRERYVILDFTPRGSVTPVTIILSDEKGRRMTIDVFSTTGAVEVYKGEPADYAEEEEASS